MTGYTERIRFELNSNFSGGDKSLVYLYLILAGLTRFSFYNEPGGISIYSTTTTAGIFDQCGTITGNNDSICKFN